MRTCSLSLVVFSLLLFGVALVAPGCSSDDEGGGGGDGGSTVVLLGVSVYPPPTGLVGTRIVLSDGTVGAAYSVDITATGGTAPYQWQNPGGLPPGLNINGLSPTTQLFGTPTTAGTYDFTLTFTDASSSFFSEDFRIVVNPAPPLFQIDISGLPTAYRNLPYTADVHLTGGTAPFTWSLHAGNLPTGLVLGGSTSATTTISGTVGSSASSSNFILQAEDATGAQTWRGFKLTCTTGLSIEDLWAPPGTEGLAYDFDFHGAGSLATTYTWTVIAGAPPPGLTLTSGTPNANLSGTPTTPGTYSFTLRLTDGMGGNSQLTYNVDIYPTGTPLTIGTGVGPWALSWPVSEYREVPIWAVGGTGTGFQWSQPSGSMGYGLVLDSTGTPATLLRGQPSTSNQLSFGVRVTDSGSNVANRAIQISATTPQPLIASSGSSNGFVGIPFSIDYTGAQGNAPYVVRHNPGLPLPPGLTATPIANGLRVSGTPTSTGYFEFLLEIWDAGGGHLAHLKQLWIDPTPALAITTGSTLPNALLGTAYNQSITASGGSLSGYSWSVVAGSLPPGLTIAAAGTPSTTLAGTPTQLGQFAFQVQVQDSAAGTTTSWFSMDVIPAGGAPGILTTSLPDAVVGGAYNQSITGGGGTGNYAWSVVSGSLPPGLSLGASGTPSTVLSGVTTQAGSYSFTIQLLDQGAQTATQAYAINVTDHALDIVPEFFPEAIVGVVYSKSVVAAGGTAAGYQWDVPMGQLPPGLSVGAAGTPATSVSGTPTAPGVYRFHLRVRDSSGEWYFREYRIVVRPQAAALSILNTEARMWSYNTGEVLETLYAHGGTPPYTWDAPSGLPNFFVLAQNSGTAVLHGGLSSSTAQVVPIDLRVTDSLGVQATQTIQLYWPGAAMYPDEQQLDFTEGASANELVTLSGGAGGATWSLIGGQLPPGVTFTQAGSDGVFSGTPTMQGGYRALFRITDSLGMGDLFAFAFTVKPPSGPDFYRAAGGSTGAGSPISLTFQSQTALPIYDWSALTRLPRGVALTAQSPASAANLTGTPAYGGQYVMLIQMTDTQTSQSVVRAFVVEIWRASFLITTSSTLPTATWQSPYSATLQVTGGTTTESQWSIYGGTLPEGLQVDSPGTPNTTISGTPTGLGGYGAFNFQVVAFDADGSFRLKSFNLQVGGGPTLRYYQQPTDTVAGTAISPPIQVELVDTGGGRVTAFTGAVTLSLNANPSGSLLGGTLTQSAVAGVASFPGLTLSNPGGAHTLRASSTGLADCISSQFQSLYAGAQPQLLRFSVQPATVTAGQAFTTDIEVEVIDTSGQLATGFNGNITLALEYNAGGSSLSGTVTQAAASGVASFAGLSLNRAGDSYTLKATSTGLIAGYSDDFNVVAGAAAELRFLTPGTVEVSGVAFPYSVRVEVTDSLGNRVTTASHAITISLPSAPGVTLNGTLTQNAVNGLAEFPSLSLSAATGQSGIAMRGEAVGLSNGYAIGGYTVLMSDTYGSIVYLKYLKQPESGVAGQSLGDIVLQFVDANQHRVGNASDAVTLNISLAPTGPGPSAVLSGTKTVNAVNGIVTFSGLSLNKAGAYTLQTSCPTLPGGYSGQNPVSSPFRIKPQSAAAVSVHTQPQNGLPGGALQPVRFEILDPLGNRATGDGSSISLAMHFKNGAGALTGGTAINFEGGLATFIGLSIDQPGLYRLRGVPAVLAYVGTQQFAIAGSAARLAAISNPGNAQPGQNLPNAANVKVTDLWGTTVTTPVSVSLSMLVNPGGGVLTGTTVVNSVNGIAGFSPLQISQPGAGYMLEASAAGLVSAYIGYITIYGPVASIQASSTVAWGYEVNVAFSVAVKLVAADGTLMTTATNAVSVALGSNPGNANLAGTLTRTPAAGVVTFNDLVLDQLGSGYTLVFTAVGLGAHTSASFDIAAAGTGFYVALTGAPGSGYEGEALSTITARIRDVNGTTVTGWATSVTISLSVNPTGTSLSGTTTVMPVNGVATFTGIVIPVYGTYRIQVQSGGLFPAESNNINVVPPPAALSIPLQLQHTEQSYNFSVQVRLINRFGSNVSKSGVPVTLDIQANPGGSSFAPVVQTTNSSGIASFTISIPNPGNGYTLVATSPGLTQATSNAFDIVPPNTLARIAITGMSGTQTAGVIFNTFSVQLRDGRGQVLTSGTSAVTLSLSTNPTGATLSGTTTVNAVAGIATFTDISVNIAFNAYVIQAAVGPINGQALLNVVAAPVTPPAPTAIIFTVAPSAAPVDSAFSVTVKLVDGSGANATAPTPVAVTIGLGANPGGATISGALTLDVTTSRVFDWIVLDQPGSGYTLTANGGGLVQGLSTAIDIHVPASPARLTILSGPPAVCGVGQPFAAPLRVQIEDGLGARVPGTTHLVTLALGQNPGSASLGGTLSANAVDGVAVFTAISISAAGLDYTIVASAGGLQSAESGPIDIGDPGVPAGLEFVNGTQSSPVQTPFNPAITVRILDVYGTLCVGATNQVVISIDSGPSGAALTGINAVTAAAGEAVFTLTPNLEGTWRLRADASGLAHDVSANLYITQAAVSIAFITQPGASPAGGYLTPAPVVEIRDALGQRLISANMAVTISLLINPTATTLGGTLVVNAVAGIATFNNLQINAPGTGYVLGASMAGVPATSSTAFTVVTGGATSIVFTVQPQNGTAGQDLPYIELRCQDSVGNDVPGVDGVVSLVLGNNPTGAVIEGVTALRLVNGRAYFNRLRLDRAGTGFTLVATHPTLSGNTSSTFDVVGSPAAALRFRQVPAETAPSATIPTLSVDILNRLGRLDTSASNQVTVAIGANPSSGVLSGTLTVTASGGVATFSTLSINQAGSGYTLTATSPGLAGAESGLFDIAVTPGPRLHSMSPAYVRQDLTVRIRGTGFSTTAASNSVSFGGAAATVLDATETELVVSVPAGVATGNLTVSVGGLPSNNLAYQLGPVRVNLDSSGQQVTGSSGNSVFTPDGRYVAFASAAGTLVAGDTNGVVDTFVRDMQTGITERVSVSSAGAEATDDCLPVSISPDGRFVMFQTESLNLATHPQLGAGMSLVYLRDRQTSTTTLVTKPQEITGNWRMDASGVCASDDQRYLLLNSKTAMSATDNNGFFDAYVLDTQSGCYERLLAALPGQEPNADVIARGASRDMRYIVFQSGASNILNGDNNSQDDIFLYDRISETTRLVSISQSGAFGNQASNMCSVSADGRYVAFGSLASDLVNGDTNAEYDIFVRDMQLGVTVRANVHDTGLEANGYSSHPRISGDGRLVIFSSVATNLVNGDTNGTADVFVRDLTGLATTRLSVNGANMEGNGISEVDGLSPDGRYAALTSSSSNLVPNDTNGTPDLFMAPVPQATATGPMLFRLSARFTFAGDSLTIHGMGFDPLASRNRVLFNGVAAVVTTADEHLLTVTVPAGANSGPVTILSGDRTAGRAHAFVGPVLVTVGPDGTPAPSSNANVRCTSHDGRYTIFSGLGALVFDDTNGLSDVYCHDRETGITERVSVGTGFIQGNSYSQDASCSGDGRLIALESNSSNLVAGDTNGVGDIFLYDRWSRTMQRAPGGSIPQADDFSGQPAMSMDGGWLAFSSWATNLVTGDTNNFADVFLYCLRTGVLLRASLPSSGEANYHCFEPSVSDNGAFVAFDSTASNLVAVDTNGEKDVFLFGRATAVVTRISEDSGGAEGNGFSGAPKISADGTVVVFTSEASNLVTNDTNGNVRDAFLRVIATGQTSCLSRTPGGATGNGETWAWGVSADGRMVSLSSDASDLVAGDTNNNWDVFVVDRLLSTLIRASRHADGSETNANSDGGVTQDGAEVVVQISEALAAQDTNLYADGYAVTTGR
ncbi:MAG: IPT/TIG domain-containing protein [Planctomycetes bacterium]|nr:IPT/TIG domain-containing protein [Planctomycetota bacterium]